MRDGHGIEPPTVPNIPGFSRLFWEESVPTSAQHAGHNVALQHDRIVMQMNEVRHLTSGCVQCRLPNLLSMIDETGCSAGDLEIPIEQETTMLKTISAALLAASVFAAPVLAAESAKTTANAPVVKSTQTKTIGAKTIGAKSTGAKSTAAKSTQLQTIQPGATESKPAALNANAKMDKHHRKHVSHRHSRHHGKMAALNSKAHAKATLKSAPKVSLKPAASASKRG